MVNDVTMCGEPHFTCIGYGHHSPQFSSRCGTAYYVTGCGYNPFPDFAVSLVIVYQKVIQGLP